MRSASAARLCDTPAIIAAVRVARGKVETGLRSKRLLDVTKLLFEGSCLLPPPERGRAGVGVGLNCRLREMTPTRHCTACSATLPLFGGGKGVCGIL